MAKVKEDRCAVRRRMHTDLAPWVAEFTRHLLETGHTALCKTLEDMAAALSALFQSIQ